MYGMVLGLEIDKNALLESFARIRKDIEDLKFEVETLKEQNRILMQTQGNSSKANVTEDLITDIVQKTISQVSKPEKTYGEKLVKKINKNRKSIIKNRILTLANEKRLTLPDIKEKIVDEEELCSKATFYRYIERLKTKNIISFLNYEESNIVINIEKEN